VPGIDGSSVLASSPVAADGAMPSIITVRLVTAGGEPIVGRPVRVTSTLGTVTDPVDGDNLAETDANGQVALYARSTKAGDATLSAVVSPEGTVFPVRPVVQFVAPTPTASKTTQAGGLSYTVAGQGVAGGGATARLTGLDRVEASELPDLGKPDPASVEFSLGLLSFAARITDPVTGLPVPGRTVSFAITYPIAIPPGTPFYGFGPTPDNHAPHWYLLPDSMIADAADGDATVTILITDGGLGDGDLAANGVIVDPVGPGMVPTIPTLSDWAVLAGLMLVALLAIRRLRRRSFPAA
jgi:hypothetical protein